MSEKCLCLVNSKDGKGGEQQQHKLFHPQQHSSSVSTRLLLCAELRELRSSWLWQGEQTGKMRGFCDGAVARQAEQREHDRLLLVMVAGAVPLLLNSSIY